MVLKKTGFLLQLLLQNFSLQYLILTVEGTHFQHTILVVDAPELAV